LLSEIRGGSFKQIRRRKPTGRGCGEMKMKTIFGVCPTRTSPTLQLMRLLFALTLFSASALANIVSITFDVTVTSKVIGVNYLPYGGPIDPFHMTVVATFENAVAGTGNTGGVTNIMFGTTNVSSAMTSTLTEGLLYDANFTIGGQTLMVTSTGGSQLSFEEDVFHPYSLDMAGGAYQLQLTGPMLASVDASAFGGPDMLAYLEQMQTAGEVLSYLEVENLSRPYLKVLTTQYQGTGIITDVQVDAVPEPTPAYQTGLVTAFFIVSKVRAARRRAL
jgi:hypothetical protein